jgi:CRISPR system Cascade subunit CasD
LVDYHTVQNTLTAEGKIKDTHLTWRLYLCDASFVAVLVGEKSLVGELGAALRNPKWGLWLGRKACIPTAPIYVGVYDTEGDALRDLLRGQPLPAFSHQREVDRFEDGTDTLPDQPLCFGGSSRSFAPRRIRLVEARHE